MGACKVISNSQLNIEDSSINNNKLRTRRLNIKNLRRHTDLLTKFSLHERITRFISSFNNEVKPQGSNQLKDNLTNSNSLPETTSLSQEVIKCLHRSRSRRPRNQPSSCSASSTSQNDANIHVDGDDELSVDQKLFRATVNIKNTCMSFQKTTP